MRPVHGSMMDAVGTCPGDAEKLPGRLLAAIWPDAERPHPASLAWAPVARGAALQSLCGQVAGRHTAHSLQAALALPALAFDARAWQEGLALAQASLQQCAGLQAAWMEGLTELAVEMGQLRQANTVSKYVDQEMDLVQQVMALVTNQLTASARLSENVQNNVAFWMSQRAIIGAQAMAADPPQPAPPVTETAKPRRKLARPRRSEARTT